MSDILQLAIIELVKYSVPRAADAAVEQLKMLRIPARPSEGRVGWTVVPDGCSPRARSVRHQRLPCRRRAASACARQEGRNQAGQCLQRARRAVAAMDRHRSGQGALPVRASNSPCGPRSGTGAKRHAFEAPLELSALSLGRSRLAAPWWRGQRAAGRPVHDARRAQGPLRILAGHRLAAVHVLEDDALVLRRFSGREREPDATHVLPVQHGRRNRIRHEHRGRNGAGLPHAQASEGIDEGAIRESRRVAAREDWPTRSVLLDRARDHARSHAGDRRAGAQHGPRALQLPRAIRAVRQRVRSEGAERNDLAAIRRAAARLQ